MLPELIHHRPIEEVINREDFLLELLDAIELFAGEFLQLFLPLSSEEGPQGLRQDMRPLQPIDNERTLAIPIVENYRRKRAPATFVSA
jgi:hypothetical protein